jgi:YesN/AraC family two-component response regulator
VVFVSRFEDEALWIEAIQRGAYDYLSKPLDLSELKRILLHAAEKNLPRAHEASSSAFIGIDYRKLTCDVLGTPKNIGAEFLQSHRGLPGALNSQYLARHGETAWSLRAQDTGLRISR